MWVALPTPADAKVTPPGRERARASSSAGVRTPRPGWVTSIIGPLPISATGRKPATGSNGRFFCSTALIANADEVSSSVWPSGVARDTCAAPSEPPEPGRFSTVTGRDHARDSEAASVRANRSLEPPVVNGTTMVTSRAGNCA